MASSNEEFLTVHEVAAILKVNQQTVRNWIDHGELPAIRIGRRVRITRSDFERVLEQSRIGPGRGVHAGRGAGVLGGRHPTGAARTTRGRVARPRPQPASRTCDAPGC